MPKKGAHRTEKERAANRASAAAFYAANKEKVLARRRTQYAADPEKILARNKAFRVAHIDECRAKAREASRKQRELFPEKIKEWAKKCRRRMKLEEPEKLRAFRLERYWSDPEKARERARIDGMNRRAWKMGDCSRIRLSDVEILWGRQNGICPWCNEPLGQEKPDVDHWIPLARGGANSGDNLRLLHPPCNREKWANLPPDAFSHLNGGSFAP